MTIRWTSIVMTFVCVAASMALSQDDSEAAVRTKIIALEKAWNQAYKLADTKALAEILDEQLVLINDDGSVLTRAEFLASVKKADTQEQQVSPESMSVHVFGTTAISTGVFRAKGTENGKSYVRRERFVDTWIHKDGKWVCVASNATPVV